MCIGIYIWSKECSRAFFFFIIFLYFNYAREPPPAIAVTGTPDDGDDEMLIIIIIIIIISYNNERMYDNKTTRRGAHRFWLSCFSTIVFYRKQHARVRRHRVRFLRDFRAGAARIRRSRSLMLYCCNFVFCVTPYVYDYAYKQWECVVFILMT